jgi:hypothetical protein
MKSYKQIVELLEDIEEKHLILQSFHAGPLDQVDIAKLGQPNYPLLYCEIMGVTIDNGTLTYDLELLVADMILPNLTNRTQVYSDTLQLLHDVLDQFIQSLANSNTTVDNDYKFELPASCTPFTARFDNELTGWSGSFSIEVSNSNDLCIAPYV